MATAKKVQKAPKVKKAGATTSTSILMEEVADKYKDIPKKITKNILKK